MVIHVSQLLVNKIEWNKFHFYKLNVYLVNLALADSIFLAYTTWYSLTACTTTLFLLDHSFLSGDFGCILNDLINYGSYLYASLWLVALVTLERFVATSICDPFTHRSIDTRA